ncbi:MAG: hypothetical protein P4M11_07200 [Candidatus Pacebacteria bacterium]|nr:hypothetical protein [Candidatus Paceibacterota bacterium]
MHTQNAERTKELVATLDQVQQNYLKEVLQSKRITVQQKGENRTIARRIIKPKRHLPPQPAPSSETMH